MSDSLSPRDASRALDREQTLSEIDSFLRAVVVPEKLARFINPVPPANTERATHHPDAEELLRRAHERQPTVERFKPATLRAALRGLLYDRWRMTVARSLAEQPPAVIDRVLKQLARFAPGRCGDDLWLAWCKLAKKFPHNETFAYSERQICGAWREVNAERRGWDAIGGGPQASPARQACKAALRRAAAECKRSRRELLHLQIVDYEPLAGVLHLPTGTGDSLVLSRRGRKRMETWLAIRGAAEGRLFALPAAVKDAIARDGSRWELDEQPDGHAINAAERLEEADLIEHVCDSADLMATAYLRDNVVTAGDWPEPFLESLKARCSGLGAPAERAASLDKRQRRLAREHCIRRWRSVVCR